MQTLGERIKLARKEGALTQAVLADKIGVKQNSIALIESGARNTSEPVLRAICSVFNLNYEWLVDGVEPMYRQQSDDDIELLTRAMAGKNENKKQLLRILADMPDELLDKMMEYLESKLR